MNEYIKKYYDGIIINFDNNEDTLLYAIELGRYALKHQLEFDEKALVKRICEFVLMVNKDKVNELSQELFDMLVEINNNLVLEVKSSDDLVRSMLIPRISFISCRLLSSYIYKTTSELYEDIRTVLLNKLYRKNSKETAFKRGYLYNIALIILNELEEHPEIEVNDPQLISLLNLMRKNEMFMHEADIRAKEINKSLKYSILNISI